MRQTKVRLRLLLRPFWASLKPENFHRKKTYRRPCRQNGGSDRDSHRDHSNPEPIEHAWMKRHVRDRINLWIERNQMIASGDKRERVSKNKSRKRAHRADGNSLAKKNLSNLFAARAQRTKHRNISCFIGDRHGKNHQNVEPRHEGDQSNKDGSNQFFQT